MQRNILKRSVAGLALAAMLGGTALAQTAAPAAPQAETTQPAAPAAPAAPQAQTSPTPTPAPAAPAANARLTAETLPDMLKALNLTDLEIKANRQGGSRVEGDMADGTEIDALVDDAGDLRMIRADDDAALPEAITSGMIPQAVRDNAILSQFATISGVGLRPDGAVMVGGEDSAGEELRAGFTEDGTLMRFGRGDDDRERGDRRGKAKGGEHGKGHGKGDDRRGDGPRGDGPRGDGPRGDGPRGDDAAQGPALTPDAARQALTDAGYTDIGAVLADGPRTLAEAVNRAGETVTVTLNPTGEVVREAAR